VPYCHLWPAQFYIFPHYLITAHFERKKKRKRKVLNKKRVF